MDKPDGVPPDAEWSADDNEWVLGPRNAGGEYEGEVHYWRPDGTLVSIAQLVDGKPHGVGRRFHENGEVSQEASYVHGELHGLRRWISCDEPTTELMRAPQMGAEIWRVEVEYDMGRPREFRWYLRDGTMVERDGAPLITVPAAVPTGAVHNPKTGWWMAGVWDSEGRRDGAMRVFRADGSPLSVETYRRDIPHGPHTLFYEDGGIWSQRDYVDGKLCGPVEYFHRTGEVARRGEIQGGTWVGPLVDFDRDGQVIRHVHVPPVAASTAPAPLTPDDIRVIEAFDLDEPPSPEALSPVGLAAAIAAAWAGDEYRDSLRARHARAFVRNYDDADLANALRTVGLDTAPRLLTATRLAALCEALREVRAVDVHALRHAMATEGGVGATAALGDGGVRAVEFLRSKLDDRGRLNLEHLSLQSLPSELRHLATITELKANSNAIAKVGSEIADLALLTRLELSDNQIDSLPAEMARLFDLRALHLADNGLEQLPDVVTALPELRVLNLSDNQLRELPDAFGDLEHLDTLWLSNNPLETLPASFGRLPRLTFLHLGGAPWSEPPACLWELQRLETLWLASRDLQRLPAAVGRLTNLKALHLWYSDLRTLPDELFEMTHLRELRIRDNPLPEGTIDKLREALPDCTIY